MNKLIICVLSLLCLAGAGKSSDVGITMILSPAQYTFLEKDSSYNVEVFIYNFGPDTLTQIPVIFQVGFNPVLEDTFNGVILPGSGSTFTFDSLYTITDTISFTGQAKTTLQSDSNSINDAQIIIYNLISGISALSTQLRIKVYPNPAQSVFTIQVQESADLFIIDMMGRRIKEISLSPGENPIISQLPAGTYTLLLFSNEGRASRRLVIH